MKSMVGKAVVVVLLLAAVGGLAVWLAYGDDIAQSMSGTQREAPPATAPVARETVQKSVTGVGEVKPIATEKLRPADSWHWLKSFDAPLNKRIAAGDTLVTYSNGEKWVAPYDMVVTSYELPKKNKGAVTKDDHYIEAQRIEEANLAKQVEQIRAYITALENEQNEDVIGSLAHTGKNLADKFGKVHSRTKDKAEERRKASKKVDVIMDAAMDSMRENAETLGQSAADDIDMEIERFLQKQQELDLGSAGASGAGKTDKEESIR